jgi:hypothetical protein
VRRALPGADILALTVHDASHLTSRRYRQPLAGLAIVEAVSNAPACAMQIARRTRREAFITSLRLDYCCDGMAGIRGIVGIIGFIGLMLRCEDLGP